jgi:hypothetical protein
MSIWDAAGAAIVAAFADPEPIIYTQAGIVLPDPIRVVRSDDSAPTFAGPGSTLRKITYEVPQSALPAEPTKKDRFEHRGRRWAVQDKTRRDDIGAWLLVVTDDGAVL